MKRGLPPLLFIIVIFRALISPQISFAQSGYKAFIVEEVFGYNKILLTDGYSKYIVAYNYECSSFNFYAGQTIYIDTYLSPGFYDTIVLDTLLGTETCKISSSEEVNLKKYYVDTVIDLKNEIIVEGKYGDKYIVEYGIGCLSMWRYEGKYIDIDIGGAFLNGIGDTIYLFDSDDECRVWDAQELSSLPAPKMPPNPPTILVPADPSPEPSPRSPQPTPTLIPKSSPKTVAKPSSALTPSPSPSPTASPTALGTKTEEQAQVKGSGFTDWAILLILAFIVIPFLFLKFISLYSGKN